ncbi:ATP-binding protein [candidate division KSB1 bacterium]|nr:ATP-binding protein [candidate division KSB1 bacterium]
MILSIASGKGGTGKTTIAVNLGLSLDASVQYLDCDVEEPNGHIFLNPKIECEHVQQIPIPEVDKNLCTYCGQCAQICQYNAIVVIKDNVLVFPELCHSCAGCWLVCPEHAISKKPKDIGLIEYGSSNGIFFVHGKLKLGEVLAPPLIKAVKKYIDTNKINIIDAPPGTSCPVIEAVRESDFVLLVTEPTPFGLNDLELAVEMVHKLNIPFGVVINRCDIGDDAVTQYCRQENIPIMLEIKNDRFIAEAYSKGIPLIEIYPEYKTLFRQLYSEIEGRVSR